VARRTDGNQQVIINALRSIGCTVQDLSQLGRGVPDILVGYRMRNYLFEIKNSQSRASRLTHCEEEWIRRWRGCVAVITTVEDAIAVVQDADYEDAVDRS
jgi:hypothetical protein